MPTVAIIASGKVTARKIVGPSFQRRIQAIKVADQKPLAQDSSPNQSQRRGGLLQPTRIVVLISRSNLEMNLILLVTETGEDVRGENPAESKFFTRLTPQGGLVLPMVNRPPCGGVLTPLSLPYACSE